MAVEAWTREHDVTPVAWYVVPAVATSACLLWWTSRRGAWRAGAWAALSIIGQAASVALVKAGPLVGYQHLRGWHDAMTTAPVALGLVLLSATLVLIEAVRRRAALAEWLAAVPRRWVLVSAVLLASLLAAAPSADIRRYVAELGGLALVQLVAFGCVALAVAALPDELARSLEQRLDAFLNPPDARPERFAWWVAAAVVVASAGLSLASYQGHPHVPDEVAYLLQARYFAHGMPWLPPPPVPAGFDTFLVELSGDRWYSVFPPGWPAVLALGVLAGVPWLVNPLLGGLCVLLTYALVGELADRRLARLSALLLALSPWHLFLSMSLMSHVLSLALALGAGLGAVRAWRSRRWLPALLAGLALGVLGMSRPLEGVAAGVVIGIPMLAATVRRRIGVLPVLALGAGTLLTGMLGLWYNRVITGSMFVFPAERYFDRVYGPGRYGIGFSPTRGVGWTGLDPFPGHGALDVVVNTALNGFMVNVDLFGWWTGSVALLALGMLVARGAAGRAMLVALLAIVGAHAFYWFSGGPDFGARYWFLIIVPCVVLVAQALEQLREWRPGGRFLTGASLLSLGALVVFVPWRASDKYYHYRGMRPDLGALVADPGFGNGLVLVQGNRHPDWASASVLNPLDLRATGPIFAWDRDAATRQALLEAYPDRPVWVVEGPTLTSGGYVVRQGPVAVSDRSTLVPVSRSGPGM